ncbi:PREDICTED: uncharacterized protein LOC109174391 [Ipomoea nil]|uniref:uncharacterized protein LOC109174391 n=1 Tax=Ipomoea nil TaxID=35883 RepID=UPI000900AD8A|nr:PREDICTED: uncharacterized protein LOC109174391 [Ipomoea nil]
MYVDNEANEDDESEDRLDEMFRDVGEEFTNRSNELDELLNDSKQPLWPGCSKYTRLSAVLKLFNLKAGNGWSNKSFTALLDLINDMLPEDNGLPKSTYDAKKIMCPMGMEYEKIHACPNDCILFRNDYKELNACPICGASRYKIREHVVGKASSKGPPAKVMWYLPILPRFKRMFANSCDAKNLTWHADQKISDGKLRHPADSTQWKTFDNVFPEFGNESRNLRLGLCTDGINPHGNLSSKHSSWPVMLVIYNLLPWLCMKRKYILLSLMISGPKQPGNDIDVFLAPLIDDLKKLWDEGVLVFDAYRKENFKLHAMLFCTINDFPAYGNLAGYSVKGHKACPICEDNTCYTQLVHGRKSVYLGHRRFLDRAHPYRRLKKAFNGQQYYTDAPQPMTGIEVYECVKGINVTFGKTQKLKSQRGKRLRANVEQLLPVAVRGILPKKLRYTIIRFCFFFNAICGKVIDPDKLDELQNGIVVTLSQLEMYFPPSFFDVMVHLVVHLVREIKQCGPAYLRWMYPFERYIAKEVTEFCTEYLAGVEAIGLSKYRYEGRSAGKGTRGRKVAGMPREDIEEAHLYILHNTSEVEPYLDEHKALIKDQNPRKTDMWIVSEHNRTFISWFKKKVLSATNYSETVRWEGHKNEQFIMASQAKQVFFVTDPSDKKWSVVLHGKRQITGEGNEDVSYEIEEIPPFSSSLLPVIIDNEIDEVHASRDDHHEGLWEN